MGMEPEPPAPRETPTPRRPAGASFWALASTKHYPALFLCGLLSNTAKEGAVFVVGHLTQQLTQSPRLVGLVSAAQFAGLLLGPLGGWVSDCFDRRRVVIASKLLAIPITLLVSWCMAARARLSTNLVVAAGFAFTFCQGLTFVLDQTSRRALVSDTVGLRLLPMAFAMESISSNVSNTLGAQFGGLAIQYLGGHGAVLRFLACLQAISSLLAWTVSAPSVVKAAAAELGIVTQLREGLSELRRNRTFQSILGVTIIVSGGMSRVLRACAIADHNASRAAGELFLRRALFSRRADFGRRDEIKPDPDRQPGLGAGLRWGVGCAACGADLAQAGWRALLVRHRPELCGDALRDDGDLLGDHGCRDCVRLRGRIVRLPLAPLPDGLQQARRVADWHFCLGAGSEGCRAPW